MVTQTYGPICRGKKGLGDQIITNEMMDQRHELFLSLPQDVAENYVFGLLGWRKFHRGKPSGDAIKRDGMHLFFVPAIGTFIQTNFIEKVDLREYDSWFQWAHLNRMGEKLATRTTVTKEADLVARLIRQLPNAPWCVLPRPHPLQLQRNQLPYSQLNQHPPPSHNLPNLWPSEFNTLPAISGTPVKPNKQLPGVLSVLAGSYAIPDQSQEPVPTGTTARQQPAPYQNPQGFNQTPYAGASEPTEAGAMITEVANIPAITAAVVIAVVTVPKARAPAKARGAATGTVTLVVITLAVIIVGIIIVIIVATATTTVIIPVKARGAAAGMTIVMNVDIGLTPRMTDKSTDAQDSGWYPLPYPQTCIDVPSCFSMAEL
ncbi:hypothetical protein F5Y04DRAFT_280970 [Hypomontagnella monticulosa]|nr:hypothetical protein F5Y04DRAFT_280970 [Hypomontagnella monticulosa]